MSEPLFIHIDFRLPGEQVGEDAVMLRDSTVHVSKGKAGRRMDITAPCVKAEFAAGEASIGIAEFTFVDVLNREFIVAVNVYGFGDGGFCGIVRWPNGMPVDPQAAEALLVKQLGVYAG